MSEIDPTEREFWKECFVSSLAGTASESIVTAGINPDSIAAAAEKIADAAVQTARPRITPRTGGGSVPTVQG